MTSTPLRARLSAVLRPSPRLPPVTIAIFMGSPLSPVQIVTAVWLRNGDPSITLFADSEQSRESADGPSGCDEDFHARDGTGELHQGRRLAGLAQGQRLDRGARP